MSKESFMKKYEVKDYLYLMKDYFYFLTFTSQIKIICSMKYPNYEKVDILKALSIEDYKKALNNWKKFGSMNIRELMKDKLIVIPDKTLETGKP